MVDKPVLNNRVIRSIPISTGIAYCCTYTRVMSGATIASTNKRAGGLRSTATIYTISRQKYICLRNRLMNTVSMLCLYHECRWETTSLTLAYLTDETRKVPTRITSSAYCSFWLVSARPPRERLLKYQVCLQEVGARCRCHGLSIVQAARVGERCVHSSRVSAGQLGVGTVGFVLVGVRLRQPH